MLSTKLEELKDQRLLKLDKVRSLGLSTYPQPNLTNRQSAAEAREMSAQEVVVAGRLMTLRGHGKISFADLIDSTGKIQLFFKNIDISFLDLGDVISATGQVFTTQAGEVTINVKAFQLLAKAIRPFPEKWHGLKDTEERYRQRYIDLVVNPAVRQVFMTRTKILTQIRSFLDDHGFIEVETPILQPVYGGASAKPFTTHHNELGEDMYLRISNELYLKRLIVGGFDKVYEVSRDFRNESVSRFHNPEFTQIEFYWAYADYEVLMNFTQDLVTHIIGSIQDSLIVQFQDKTLDFTPPWPRLTFKKAILDKTGIDIDNIKTESDFDKELETKNLKLEIADAIGLGARFDALYKEYVRPSIVQPTYIIDYPASMIALAKRKEDDPEKIASFQLLACGTELMKAYNELNDPQDQRARWLDEESLAKRGAQAAMQLDEDYIRALEYGMPPTAGWGMGIDRLTQFLTNQPTIKDVILFPSMRSEKTNLPVSDQIGLANPKIVIGQVVDIAPVANADKLKVFQVKISDEKTLNIVSACTNVKIDDIVPVALEGAVVHTPDGSTMKIKVAKLRGVLSEAMMCSPLELGLDGAHEGIYLLSANLAPHLGQPVSDFVSK